MRPLICPDGHGGSRSDDPIHRAAIVPECSEAALHLDGHRLDGRAGRWTFHRRRRCHHHGRLGTGARRWSWNDLLWNGQLVQAGDTRTRATSWKCRSRPGRATGASNTTPRRFLPLSSALALTTGRFLTLPLSTGRVLALTSALALPTWRLLTLTTTLPLSTGRFLALTAALALSTRGLLTLTTTLPLSTGRFLALTATLALSTWRRIAGV